MKGYAAKVDGEINTATVSGTERAAMVNGLVTLFNIMPLNNWTDSEIRNKWVWACSKVRAEKCRVVTIVPVEITELQ